MIKNNIDLIAVGVLLVAFAVVTHARRAVLIDFRGPQKIMLPGSVPPHVTLTPPSLRLYQD